MYHVFKIFQTGNWMHWHFQCWSHCLPSEGAWLQAAGLSAMSCTLTALPSVLVSATVLPAMAPAPSAPAWLPALHTRGDAQCRARHPGTAVTAPECCLLAPLRPTHGSLKQRASQPHGGPDAGCPRPAKHGEWGMTRFRRPRWRPVTGALGLILGSAFQDWRGRVGVQCPPGRALPYVVFLDK